MSYDCSLVDSEDFITGGGEGELEPLLFPIGVKERLVDGDGVGEGYMFCIKGRNNGPLREASYPKSEERFIGKYGL